MQILEKWIFGIMLGGIFPVLGFLSFFLGAFIFLPEKSIPYTALIGLLCGVVVDVLFLKKWINMMYKIDLRIIMVIYLFYSFWILGIFMGFPVFNVVLSFPAGLYIGGRIIHNNINGKELVILAKKTCVFTTGVLFIICITSGTIALVDPFTISFLQHILPVPFIIKQWMMLVVVGTGGLFLLSLQWIGTGIIIRKTYSAYSRNSLAI